ncbi:oxidoreductase [Clostridium thermosuccinogenes]|jgi:NAD(P)-dependent dehydrogenase (short-subunit alcohol dehydrogenase family)|uniref:Oxidoreductase n=1 Tax=Clostridium thermosuccinogenes TaxID=84032 RepID=A0A2K2F7F0_9CLOT|nr:SDR family oxidoreductase [Pseudoclostridium thermosuccinogenes]AUS94981.1 oxidoreductase [Pseudoclostridium thermosuccinogenes]PNT91352.1 oxidoreductase [Pseudoclostridium thermosuccinogenes]PNT94707.1 oxidoreductase [Pseudoclostridium thermosuccinogenes]PNT95245.1 oxidoreductase [Pseudoclostridium thermosuccinogenes]
MNITDFNMDFFSLKGKNAIVTGGNTGLGQAFSLALAKAGANILMPSIMPDDPEFNRLIEAEGVKVVYMYADITKPGVPRQIVEKCVEVFGSVDILVNCAGICICKPVLEFDRTSWDPMISINLTAAFEMTHEVAKFMIPQRSGKIINICSMFSFLGGQWSPAYAASKHGIAGLTKAYCDELAQYNIQVNGIAPGYFKTKVAEASMKDPERNKWIVDHTPEGRWGDVADLMGTTVFLASKASQFVNGHILAVDGGFLTR